MTGGNSFGRKAHSTEHQADKNTAIDSFLRRFRSFAPSQAVSRLLQDDSLIVYHLVKKLVVNPAEVTKALPSGCFLFLSHLVWVLSVTLPETQILNYSFVNFRNRNSTFRLRHELIHGLPALRLRLFNLSILKTPNAAA